MNYNKINFSLTYFHKLTYIYKLNTLDSNQEQKFYQKSFKIGINSKNFNKTL